jgi:hypothetical protein
MSKTTLYEVNADGKGLVIVTGRFTTTGTVSSGLGFTAADSGTGIYTVTFDDQYSGFISCVSSLEADTPGDVDGWRVATSTYTAAASPTLVFNVVTDAASPTAADLPNATSFINFIAVFRNTSVTT